jgi:cell shape-determining protein MreD
MKFLKLLGLFFLALILAVGEISFPFFPEGISLVFIFCLLALINNGKKPYYQREKLRPYIVIFAFMAGLFLDIFSFFPPGVFILSLLTITYLIDKIFLPQFNFNSFLSIFIFSLLSNLIYYSLILFFVFLMQLIGLMDFPIIINKFYLLITGQAIFFNSVLVCLFFAGQIFFLKQVKK